MNRLPPISTLLELAVLRGAEVQIAQASKSISRSPRLLLVFAFSWEIQVSSPREVPSYLFFLLRCLFLKPGLLFLIFF